MTRTIGLGIALSMVAAVNVWTRMRFLCLSRSSEVMALRADDKIVVTVRQLGIMSSPSRRLVVGLVQRLNE